MRVDQSKTRLEVSMKLKTFVNVTCTCSEIVFKVRVFPEGICLWFKVAGCGFWIPGFGFRVSCFEFLDSGIDSGTLSTVYFSSRSNPSISGFRI